MSYVNVQPSQPDSSIIKNLIESALVAFPDDSHQHVLQYLLEAGLEEAQALKFRQAWSKVILGTQAFGKNSKSIVNPALFSEELIRELSYSDDAVIRIMNSCASAFKLNKQNEVASNQNPDINNNPRDSVVSLDAINSLGEDLTKLLANLYAGFASPEADAEEYQIERLEAIGLFRKSLRGTRIVWSGAKSTRGGEYAPLDSAVHGFPELRSGRIDIQLRSERNDLNVYMSTDELLGVVISSKQAVHQERGSSAHLCLTELLSSRGGLNIFPLPVGVQRDPTSLTATFAFEATPGALLLKSVQGPALSTYLRRVPIVVHHWCAQLGEAFRALHTCSGSLMKPVRAERDVFIREDGLLLLGNVAFDSTPPSRKPRQGVSFLQMACEVLQSSLCLSRTEAVQLQDSFGGSAGEYADGGGDADALESDVVFAVAVGSTLLLAISGHHCTSLLIGSQSSAAARNTAKKENADVYRNKNRSSVAEESGGAAAGFSDESAKAPPSASTLAVDVAVSAGSYTQYVTVQSAGRAAGPSSLMKIVALQPGVVSLHLSALVQVQQSADGAGQGQGHIDSNHSSARLRLRSCRVKVVVVPAYSIMSVPLQDLIGHLEECQRHSDPRILLHSQLFQRLLPSPDGPAMDSVKSFSAKTQDVQKGWQDIKRVLNNHGHMHVPAK